MSEPRDIKVLLVDDDPDDLMITEGLLMGLGGFEIAVANSYLAGLVEALRGEHDVLILDHWLGFRSGLDLLDDLKNPDAPTIMLTDISDRDAGLRSLRAGAADHVPKRGLTGDILSRSVRHALERKSARKEIEEASAGAVAIRDQFLSHVSHELRTPITAISQFVGILLDGLAGDLTEEQRQFLEIAQRNSEELKNMVEQLLSVTRAADGNLTMEMRAADVGVLVHHVLNKMGPTAEECQIELTCEIKDVPAGLVDTDAVEQVITNLVGNALKFTPDGHRVSVSLGLDEDEELLAVTVSDTGCGIAKDSLEKVFDRLYQDTSRVEHSRNGLGLGLFISSQIVALHGGRISVKSELEKGSQFTFTVPRYSLQKTLDGWAREHEPNSGQPRVLSVELVPASGGAPRKKLAAAAVDSARGIISEQIRSGLLLPRHSGPETDCQIFAVCCAGDEEDATTRYKIEGELSRCHAMKIARLVPIVSSQPAESCPEDAEVYLSAIHEHLLEAKELTR